MTIFKWILVTALAVAFLMLAIANRATVEFHLPQGGEPIHPQVWLVVLASFLAGWLPMWLYHITHKAVLTRRLAKAERGIADGRIPAPDPLPSQAQPTIVPPAGA